MRYLSRWLLAVLCSLSGMLSAQGAPFPYEYTPEPTPPSWPFARVEGRDAGYLMTHLAEYGTKFAHKKFSAPIEELVHFENQRRLQAALRDLPVPRAVSSMALVGDVMWIGKSWSSFLSAEVLAILNRHPFVFGNLESPIATGRPVSKPLPFRFVFNSPPELVTTFRRSSQANTFTAFSVVNNHALDMGDEGVKETLEFLRSERVAASGVRLSSTEKPYVVVKRNGIRIGFYAAGFGINGRREQKSKRLINIIPGLAPDSALKVDVNEITRVLAMMAQDRVDLKVVSLHWGFEYEYYPHPHHMVVAREIVRAGADIIMGHHPHVQQPDEVCFVNGAERRLPPRERELARRGGCLLNDGGGAPRQALVVYSLGNFLSSMETFLCQLGVVKSLALYRDAEGRVRWALPQQQFVVNVREIPPMEEHQLVTLERFLESQCYSESCPRSVMEDLERVLGFL
jgi:poly-gamma-glutamate capsule biosynthesis protein CapA/YwtB (metallophosphatase superfamily)